MKTRNQQGIIYEASDSFYVRYFEMRDGVRKRVSYKLHDRDEDHYSTTCRAVKLLRDRHMLTVNENTTRRETTPDKLVTDYWKETYLAEALDDLTREELREFINFLLNESRQRQITHENRVDPAMGALAMLSVIEGKPELELRFRQMLRLIEVAERFGSKLRF